MQTQDTSLDARVPLFDHTGEAIAHAIVDFDDLATVSVLRWHVGSNGYARSNPKRELVLMHRLILGLHRGGEISVDHINRDRLDNRRANLRLATHAENMRNKGPRGTKLAAGVYFEKSKRKWRARIRKEGVPYHIGYFDSEEAASIAANAWSREHLPERWMKP